MPQPAHLLAIERIAPTLRALRHSDGTLARFHGGGPGREGQLDQALAASGIRASGIGANSLWDSASRIIICAGTLTGSVMARLAPRAAASSQARATASRLPAMTICPGALRLAALQVPPSAAAARPCTRPRPPLFLGVLVARLFEIGHDNGLGIGRRFVA